MTVTAGLVALALVLAVAAPARGQGGAAPDPRAVPGRPVTAPDDELVRRRLIGTLTGVKVTVEFEGVPAREAFGALGRKLRISLIGRYLDDLTGHGIDPRRPVTHRALDRPGLEVLEEMLRQCEEPGAPCTWQLRGGFVEYGTKERLSVPAARETRLYAIADLIVDIPEDPMLRTRREVIALDLVQRIVETIEPGIWDYGQPAEEDDIHSPPLLQAAPDLRVEPDGGAPPPADTEPSSTGETAPAPAAPVPAPTRYVAPRTIAIIRSWRDLLIVHAPDYVHRQIGGKALRLPGDDHPSHAP